ncbi:hypothetical protein OUZ56_021243 [Daphnia magna]|uniref:Uncharacterized protein n=1 Tax=Daphnia magna TaxID=35525 RepID=A0ABQ9ZI88_9CRUS|nr:hypothetical protein OUZ56_021243 [Daphnia magna]
MQQTVGSSSMAGIICNQNQSGLDVYSDDEELTSIMMISPLAYEGSKCHCVIVAARGKRSRKECKFRIYSSTQQLIPKTLYGLYTAWIIYTRRAVGQV